MRKKEIIELLNRENERLADKVAKLNDEKLEQQEELKKLSLDFVDLNAKKVELEKENTTLKKLLGSAQGTLQIVCQRPHIKRIISNDGVTVVFMESGSKVIVKKAKGDKGDIYSAVAYAIVEEIFNSNHQFKKYVNSKLPKEEVERIKKQENVIREKEKRESRHIKINWDNVLTEPKGNGNK